MTNPLQNVHPLPLPQPTRHVGPPGAEPRLQLSPAEVAAVSALILDDDSAISARHASERATALAGAAGADVRRRCLAKAAAVADAQMAQLSAVLAASIAKRDAVGAALVDRALLGATKRFCLLAQELRAEEQRMHRPVVVIGAANTVSIGTPR